MRSFLYSWVFLLTLVLGCGEQHPETSPTAAPPTVETFYEIVFADGGEKIFPVGHSKHVLTIPAKGAKELIQLESQAELHLQIGTKTTQVTVSESACFTPKGVIKKLSTNLAGQSFNYNDTGGAAPFDEQTRCASYTCYDLYRKPLQPQEKRTYRILVPAIKPIFTTLTLAGQKMQEVELYSGEKKKLLQILATTEVGDVCQQETLWMDTTGRILRRDNPSMKMTSFAVSKKVYEKTRVMPYQGVSSSLLCRGAAENLGLCNEVTYLVRDTKKDASPPKLLGGMNGHYQLAAMSEDGKALRITVRNIRGGAAPFDVNDASAEKYLQVSKTVDWQTPEVKELAKVLAEKNPGTLEEQVRKLIRIDEAGTLIIRASKVLKEARGDCKAKAVLLIAIARAAKIPARMAYGLIQMPNNKKEFGFHAWAEIYQDGHWLPCDPGFPGAAPNRIKVGHTQPAEAFEALQNMLPFFSGVELEVVNMHVTHQL